MDIVPGYVGVTLKPGSLIKRKANCHTCQNNNDFLGQFWVNSVVKMFSFVGDIPGHSQRRKVVQSKATGIKKNFKKKCDYMCTEIFTAAFVRSSFQ